MAYYTVLTTVGIAWIVDKLDDTVSTVGDWVGWGTGAGEALVSNTILSTEDSAGSPPYARIQGTKSQPSADKKRVVATIVANAGKTITNAGLFTAVTSGTLIVHGNFAGITLATNDKIEFTIDIQIT